MERVLINPSDLNANLSDIDTKITEKSFCKDYTSNESDLNFKRFRLCCHSKEPSMHSVDLRRKWYL